MVNSLLLLVLSSASGLQDPSRPLTSMEPEITEPQAASRQGVPRLEAIFTGGARASAIIDGRYYQLGDAVAGYRLERIQSNHVVLGGEGEPLTLTLFSSLSTLSSQ